jgi:hypothetical protein
MYYSGGQLRTDRVEKPFEFVSFGGREVGQHLLLGRPHGHLRAFQQGLLTGGGELCRQRPTGGHPGRPLHRSDVLLGISRAAAYRLVASNELPVRRLGGRVYIVTAGLRELVVS